MNKRFRIYELRFKNWIKENKKEAIILGVILLVGAFLRLYRIGDYMTFLGDEGRDAIIIRRLWTDLDPILIGPGTSIGNMYLGPLYYYFVAPFLLLFNFSPVGPSVEIALLGVLTIFLVWAIAREWFGKIAAFVAAGFYAIAPTVIIYSRSSWNPNIMPFFSLLSVYAIWKVWIEKKYNWLLILGITFSFILQSHYLGLILTPMFAIYWFLSFIKTKKGSDMRGDLINKSVKGMAIFTFLMSPLVIFDARHGWMNLNALKKFFLERQTTVSAKPWNAFPEMWPLAKEITTSLLAARTESIGVLIAFVLVVLTLWVVGRWKSISASRRFAYIMIFSWLGLAFVGLGIYKQEIYDHYYGFFFTAPFLLLGAYVEEIVRCFKKYEKIFVFTLLLFLVALNIKNSPIKSPPNMQLQRAEKVAEKIIQEAGEEKFNVAVIAERNYEDGYQYFLEKEGARVVEIDAQRVDETITEQLFAICELPYEKCQPVTNPKAQVANFGWSKIEEEWEVAGVTLFKLVHVEE